jgi:UDP-4-amino-4,6-dideoxy-N-acetyl-beta-L-altrosamine N-acetyltransferase
MEQRDLERVLRWRNAPRIRAASHSDRVIEPDEHRAWFARVREDGMPTRFVFECEGRPVGVVTLADVDREAGRCTWGFYLGVEDAPRGAGTAMGFLALERIFEGLGFSEVTGQVLAGNEASARFHERLGFALRPDGGDAVRVYRLSRAEWLAERPALADLAFGTGR